jgi:hypothetical protein
VANFSLDMVLIFGLGLGVAGAALATSASQYLSAAVLVLMLVRRGHLDLKDLLQPPGSAEVLQFLKARPAPGPQSRRLFLAAGQGLSRRRSSPTGRAHERDTPTLCGPTCTCFLKEAEAAS